jgi:hypothetical protein
VRVARRAIGGVIQKEEPEEPGPDSGEPTVPLSDS